jgi:hypothetical protein
LDFLDGYVWQAEIIGFKAQYQVINDFYASLGIQQGDYRGVLEETYTMPYYVGKQTTINFSVNLVFSIGRRNLRYVNIEKLIS